MKTSYNNGEELEEDVKKLWKSVPSDFIKNLYASMQRRIKAVLEAKGDVTEY